MWNLRGTFDMSNRQILQVMNLSSALGTKLRWYLKGANFELLADHLPTRLSSLADDNLKTETVPCE